MYKEVYKCRNCGGELYNILNLGEVVPSNFISNDKQTVGKVPLVLSSCEDCNLVQLKHTVDLDLMYRKYWYKSGVNSEMVEHLRDIVQSASKYVKLEKNDVVLDIGCNDGTMLSFYPDDVIKIGFDPAYNLANEAKKNCTYFINNYFSIDYYPLLYRAKIITAIAVFYDLEDPNKFLEDVIQVLDIDGIFVIQFADLYSMLKTNDFSNICHEHIEYYDLSTIKKMFENHGLRIFRVEHNAVNGGSLRVYADLKVRDIDDSVQKQLGYEYEFNNHTTVESFYNKIQEIKNIVYNYIYDAKESGKTICILGASTKGNTILQYFGIDNQLIDYACDTNKEKWGLKTVGTDIEIQGDDFVFARKPDYMLILPWFFANNFIGKYHKYLMEDGGAFIIPLPEPRMVSKDGWFTLDGKALNKERII